MIFAFFTLSSGISGWWTGGHVDGYTRTWNLCLLSMWNRTAKPLYFHMNNSCEFYMLLDLKLFSGYNLQQYGINNPSRILQSFFLRADKQIILIIQ